MNQAPWWDRYPDRLAYELRALEAVDIKWERDLDAFRRGIMKLRLNLVYEGEPLVLDVVFPDLYPYFRFEVYAPTLNLPLHQNPFERNLCLIGRRTHSWKRRDTVAGLLQTQLPRVLHSAQATTRASVIGVEEQQAEPFSAYYVYGPSMVMMPSAWSLGTDYRSGTLSIGTVTNPPGIPPALFRGGVFELGDRRGRTLHSAPNELRQAFPGPVLRAIWVRVGEPIRQDNPNDFLDALRTDHPDAANAPANTCRDGQLRIWGVVFPEETGWRTIGEGWVFVCAFKKTTALVQRGKRPDDKKRKRKERKKNRK